MEPYAGETKTRENADARRWKPHAGATKSRQDNEAMGWKPQTVGTKTKRRTPARRWKPHAGVIKIRQDNKAESRPSGGRRGEGFWKPQASGTKPTPYNSSRQQLHVLQTAIACAAVHSNVAYSSSRA